MRADGLDFLAELAPEDVGWLFQAGEEREIPDGARLIEEGRRPEALYFPLEGLLGVFSEALGERRLSTVGPGEVLGEMSFIDRQPASATARAVERALVLAVPYAQLQSRCEADGAFATRVYRALAKVISQRLREQNREAMGSTDDEPPAHSTLASVKASLENFKSLLQRADQAALKSDGEVPEELAAEVAQSVRALSEGMSGQLYGSGAPPESVVTEVGHCLQRELLPFLLLTGTAERLYSKPRGYAGDFMSIEQIYRDSPEGAGRLGRLLDRCFLDEPAARAVRNRRALLAEEIQRLLDERDGPVRVMALACGPAREVFDVFETLDDPRRLHATLIDIDLQALAFVEDALKPKRYRRQVKLVHGNLVYLATGRQPLQVAPQDLIYSIGLIDYFNDTWVRTLLNFIHARLAPGGRTILGNFHPRNSSRALMDHVLEWRLIHRDEQDMHRLFASSQFASECARIRFEDEGVDLFAMGEKAAD